ncbi:carboxylesterase/lipase family protein [Oceanicaulis sp. MMSF_3324]|uniref:carboxylesterase/lipase family protein n=1 Tax=Oceanicaulis sp. MMSF_3324 TaxID=3046702 RepID=UPI0027400ADB|nr:carboxylesterase family protein [Oceanicaulis sp. MMSF_3324]
MTRLLRAGVVAALAITMSACSSVPEAPDPQDATQRTLSYGDIVGYTADNGAQVWLGLPYAASTAGENRWRAPQPATPFAERFEALTHSEPCPQIINRLSTRTTGRDAGELFGSEDCLKLDVYAPSGAGPDNANRPVMVWIHGGSNTWGFASQYDGSKLAQAHDVVVVVIQYRLGPLGFFAHPEIDEGEGANFALLDHVAALEWVSDEITQFGGDPDTVTIFGESAGGQNVAALLASPLASGLYHRAVVQSGFFDSTPLDEAQSGTENSAIPAAERMLSGEPTAYGLRNAPLQAVFDAYNLGDARAELPRVIADGVTLPREGLASTLDDRETFNAVPVISGVNRDEMKLFNALNPELTRQRFGVLISIRDPNLYERRSYYQSRLWRILAIDQPFDLMSDAGHDALWAYRFDWDDGGSVLTMDLSEVFGAAHAMEIPFVFNHFDFFGPLDRFLFHRENVDSRAELAAEMGAYWTEFARTGDPGAGWPAWTEDGVLKRFDAPSSGLLEGTDSVELLLDDLATDPALDTADTCHIAEALITWRDELEARIRSRTGCGA